MEVRTILDEIEETIARIETLNRTQMTGPGARSTKTLSLAAQRLYKSRQARLWWLQQVRNGMLADKPKTARLN